jgi:peroxiredoxin
VTKAGGPDDAFQALPALHVVFLGEIAMNINDKAPEFTLQDENGKEVALKDFLGKTVVLYFYPRADTPG